MHHNIKPTEWETFQVKTEILLQQLCTKTSKSLLKDQASTQGYNLSTDNLCGFTSKTNTNKVAVNTNQQLRLYLHAHCDKPRFGVETVEMAAARVQKEANDKAEAHKAMNKEKEHESDV